MSSRDDPAVGDDGRPALVFELAGLVLSERDLPGPASVPGLGPVDDPALPPSQTARLSPSSEDLATDLLQCLVNKHRSVLHTPGATFGLTII